MRTERHPTLDILVREDGMVLVPATRTTREHWTAGCLNTIGYRVVRIRYKLYLVHRLVAETFIPNPENKPEVDHIDRNRSNNSLKNLRWVFRIVNQRNRDDHDRVEMRDGVHWYADHKRYWKEQGSRYREDHKHIRIANGKHKWVPTELALELLKLPVKERIL